MTASQLPGTLFPARQESRKVANMTKHRRSGLLGRRWIPIVLAAAGLAALAACGGDERLSREAFGDRLQSIERWGSTRYEGLARQAMRLRPDQPLTAEVKRGMRQYARGLARAADRLGELNPPEPAEKETANLIEALRQRASGFEQAARKPQTTLRELERERSTTRAGERIDLAFEQLREDGFLTISPDHPGHHPPGNSRREYPSGSAHHDGGYYRALSRRSRATQATPCCDPAR
jgi:hypothetical protein